MPIEVTIAAIAATAVVGVLGALVPAVAAGRRQDRAQRHERDLRDEERDAERRRDLRENRRRVLEEGAALLRQYMGAMSQVTWAGENVVASTIGAVAEVGPRIGAHSAVLPLYFPKGDAVVEAWDDAVAQVYATAQARSTARDAGRPELAEDTEKRLSKALASYEFAVRQYFLGD